ncbi:hypothetical protein CXF85_10195 [Colwellia sp. 75C3]|uniref:hypothetical protein n=1 Tax=Colwellia sp. 75C3 TaxID=888425 RepID=UPI000C332A22|nr:hypothetical protein [Colwellia sp. 75C3]PKG83859.1 hypothetical protein CXF85_10195 [Colwellia sp. 75C3]
MPISKPITTLLLSLATTSLVFSALPASAKIKQPWGFVSCSGYIQKTYDTKQNVAIYSSVFYNSEPAVYSSGKVISSFSKYRSANYPKFNEDKCTYWDYETERKAKDELNDSIASSKGYEFKVIRTGFEY